MPVFSRQGGHESSGCLTPELATLIWQLQDTAPLPAFFVVLVSDLKALHLKSHILLTLPECCVLLTRSPVEPLASVPPSWMWA
jgi:hypothetical protein